MQERIPGRARSEPLKRARAADHRVSRHGDASEREARAATVPSTCLACACGKTCARHPTAPAPAIPSDVRVHRGPDATADAAALDAVAFAVGRDIVISDAVDLSRPDGKQVLAHELVHARRHAHQPVVHRQQRRSMRDDIVWYYQAGPRDVYQPIRGETGNPYVDTATAPLVWLWNALGTAANVAFTAAQAPDIAMEAMGMSQMDRDAANFALLMTGSGEAVMLPGAMREADRRLMTWLARLRFEEALASEAPLAAEGMQWGARTRGVPTPMRLHAYGGENPAQLAELLDSMGASRHRSMLSLPYEAEALETAPGWLRRPNANSLPMWAERPELLRYVGGRADFGQCASGVCSLIMRDAGFTDAVGSVQRSGLVSWGDELAGLAGAINEADGPALFLRSLGRRMPANRAVFASGADAMAAMRARPPGTRFIVQVSGRTAEHAMYAIRAENGELVLMHGQIDTASGVRTMVGEAPSPAQLQSYTNWRFREIPEVVMNWLSGGAQGPRPALPPPPAGNPPAP